MKWEFYNATTGEIAYYYNDLTLEPGDLVQVFKNGDYKTIYTQWVYE